jgi:glycosyltransferase involved in cell wall biosynthesis
LDLQPKKPLRLAIFATHPIQYQVPIWRKLAAVKDFKVHVYYGTDMSVRGYKDKEFGVQVSWDTPLLEGYRSTFLSTNPEIDRISLIKPNAWGLGKELNFFKPDVGLMLAYGNSFHLGVWRALRSRGVPIIMRHEASDIAHARSGLKGRVRDAVLRRFYAGIDGFAYIGTEAKKHLLRLAVPDSKLSFSPYCIDSDFVTRQTERWLPQRDTLRAEAGMSNEDITLVFSGKLIPKKDPLLVVDALKCLQSEPSKAAQAALRRIHVLIAGDGQLRESLSHSLSALIGKRAHLLGFLNQGEVGKAYAMGDALFLPSRRGSGETWGLVVNEGMQWGLPAFVSDGVGSRVDLIDEGVTGWSYKTGDAKALAKIIQTYATLSPEGRKKMAEASRKKAEAYSIDRAVDGVVLAARQAESSVST